MDTIILMIQGAAIFYLLVFSPLLINLHLTCVIHDKNYRIDWLDYVFALSVCTILFLGYPEFNN